MDRLLLYYFKTYYFLFKNNFNYNYIIRFELNFFNLWNLRNFFKNEIVKKNKFLKFKIKKKYIFYS